MPQKPVSIESQEYRQLVANGQKLDELGLILKAAHDLIDATADRFAGILVAQTILLQQIADDLQAEPEFPTTIAFQETSMNPTEAGQTQVFTGTLTPAGATYPADTTFTLTSNDTAVTPTVDPTGLIVSVTYPAGWVESTTTPLAFSYTAASVSENGSISATITPSAPPAAFPTGITFAQSQ